MSTNLVIAVYSHPEYYPPTLNAVEYLSRCYDNIYIVHRNVEGFDWKYPGNVQLLGPEKLLKAGQVEKAGTVQKFLWFFAFTWRFAWAIRKYQADTVLMYDPIPLFSFRLLRRFIKKPRILWYHNHDVADLGHVRKGSIAWLGWKSEAWIFPRLQVFSLPAVERKEFFPMNKLKGRFFFIPNFPSVAVYGRYKAVEKDPGAINLLYQGSIGSQHGLEEIIPLLDKKIQGRELYLVLKGFISSEYLTQLQLLAEQYKVRHKIIYKGAGGYRAVIENAATCHIGIGIHKKQDVMNKTLGTASNKIYEYAALGLPVLLNDNSHFRSHLGHYKWTFFTDCSTGSLVECLETIMGNYTFYSEQARKDVNESLNFEKFFLPLSGILHPAANKLCVSIF